MKEQVNTLTFVSLNMEDQPYDTMTEESFSICLPFSLSRSLFLLFTRLSLTQLRKHKLQRCKARTLCRLKSVFREKDTCVKVPGMLWQDGGGFTGIHHALMSISPLVFPFSLLTPLTGHIKSLCVNIMALT